MIYASRCLLVGGGGDKQFKYENNTKQIKTALKQDIFGQLLTLDIIMIRSAVTAGVFKLFSGQPRFQHKNLT